MKFFTLLYDAAVIWLDRGAGYYAAAFSYYAPLALIPLLFISVSVVGFFYGEVFTGKVFVDWGSVLGDDLLAIIQVAVNNMSTEQESSKFTIIGSVFFLSFYVIALNVISDGFQKLWDRESRGVAAWFLRSLRSLGFIFVLQFYLILIIGIEFFVSPFILYGNEMATTAMLLATTTIFYTVLYRFLAPGAPSLVGSFVGGAVSSFFFIGIKSLVDLYVATTPVLSLYGAAGLILILLVWVYVVAALIYYGAAVAGQYDKMKQLTQ